MGSCSIKERNRPIQVRHRPTSIIVRSSRTTYKLEESEKCNSDISCNFIYETNAGGLETMIGAALAIVVTAFKNEYDTCILCNDRSATIRSLPCNHNILCSGCYQSFCLTTCSIHCPICRQVLNRNDPFSISLP